MSTKETMPEETVNESTTVDQVEINIDEIFGMPGAESVMLPEEEEEGGHVPVCDHAINESHNPRTHLIEP